MLRLSIVTTAEHRQGAATTDDGDLPHGTIVLKHLVVPWAGTKRIVCADSYFASVTAALQLLGMGLCFIGVVKTATPGYPMGALSVIPVEARGQHVAYTHSTADGVTDWMACCGWTGNAATSSRLPPPVSWVLRTSGCAGARRVPTPSAWR